MNLIKVIPPFIIHAFVKPSFYLMMKFFCRLEVHGRENLLKNKKVILAPNHVNEIDAVITGSAIPLRYLRFLPIFFTSLPGEYYKDRNKFGWRSYLYKEWFFKVLGSYPIKKNVKNYAQSLEKHIKILQRGYSVLIFPEGKMGNNEEPGEVHGGVAYVAEATNSKIIPIQIKGHLKMGFLDFFLRRRKLYVYYGKPVDIKPLLERRSDQPVEIRYREAVKEMLSNFRDDISLNN